MNTHNIFIITLNVIMKHTITYMLKRIFYYQLMFLQIIEENHTKHIN